MAIRVEESPIELPVSKVQLITAIKAGGSKKENNIGDSNYPAYFHAKRSKAVHIYMSVFEKEQAEQLISCELFCIYKTVATKQ